MGLNKLEGYLRDYRLQEIKPVSHRTIHRILVEAGLNNPIPKPRTIWGKRSNRLWRADCKMTDQDEWMIGYPLIRGIATLRILHANGLQLVEILSYAECSPP